MSKRKGKVKRREHFAIKFEDGDMAWLANEYRRLSKADPSLTLEQFSERYCVFADDLRQYIPELNDGMGRYAVVWHGTSCSRARSILLEGFKPKTKKGRARRIFFTKRVSVARRYAKARARGEDDDPAVIMCAIDLNEYDNYEHRGDGVFAFDSSCISSEVIRNIRGMKWKPPERTERQKSNDESLIDVALTFNSSTAGIAFWINSYLNLDDKSRLNEDHPAVMKIKQWLDEQMDAGRFGEVPDGEILEKLEQHLPQHLQAQSVP